MNIRKTPDNTTNILLGVIAIQVALLTVQAIAGRQPVAGRSHGPARRPKLQNSPRESLLSGVLDQAAAFLRWLLGREKTDIYRRNGKRSDSRSDWDSEGKYSGSKDSTAHRAGQSAQTLDSEEEEEMHLKGSMLGIAGKLNDPAWAGVLAANDGNISLTDAERAVPMPKSAQFVARLDRNPFVGKGMKDHPREKRK